MKKKQTTDQITRRKKTITNEEIPQNTFPQKQNGQVTQMSSMFIFYRGILFPIRLSFRPSRKKEFGAEN